jgi:hypothetical protein
MAASNSSVRGGNNEEEEPPVSRAELRQLGNSLLEAMVRMLNEHLPPNGGRDPQQQNEEFGDENSSFGNNFHEIFGAGHGGRGGGRHAGRDNRHGRGRGRGRHVHFGHDDEVHRNSDDAFDEDENPFADHGRFEHHHDHRRGAAHDGRHQHHRNRDNLDNLARIKLSVPKFTGREDPDAYLEWAEQCDQIFRVHDLSDRKRVNLASVEFSGYALTWWNQIQENQLVLGRAPIDTWAEMKQVMRRRFVPSSYHRDLRNKLQNLKQGTKSVDDYYKEMELLLIRSGIREDAESKMAKVGKNSMCMMGFCFELTNFAFQIALFVYCFCRKLMPVD